jgi:hypothetical protein
MFRRSADTVTLMYKPTTITTAIGTSAAVDVSTYDGDLQFIQEVDALPAGTCSSRVQSSTASGGTYADVTGGGFTNQTTASATTVSVVVVPQKACSAWVRVLADASTGTATVSLKLNGRKKYP